MTTQALTMSAPSDTQPPTRRRAPIAWRALLPKEHGVWAWVGLPLALAVGLAPTGAAALGALAAVAGLGAAEALGKALGTAPGRGRPGAARASVAAALLGAGLGGGALLVASRPGVLAATFAVAGAAGLLTQLALRGRAPRRVGAEAAAITGFVALGAGVAVGAGAAVPHAAAAATALFAWLLLGLGYVKRQLATVLARRTPWRTAPLWGGLAVAASVAVGAATGHLAVGLLPLAYPLRVLTARAPASARDAARVGLTELAWGAAFVVAAAVL